LTDHQWIGRSRSCDQHRQIIKASTDYQGISRSSKHRQIIKASADHQGIGRSRSCDQHRQTIKAFYQTAANALSLGDFVDVFDWEREDQQLSRSVHRTSAMEQRTSCSD
jgi:hypothetical protein